MPTKIIFNKSEEEQIIKMCKNTSVSKIAEHFNVSTPIIYNFLKQHNIKPFKNIPWCKTNVETELKVIKLINTKLPKEISKELDISHNAIKRILNSYNVPSRFKNRKYNQIDMQLEKQIIQLSTMLTVKQIAKLFGISETTVYKILNDAQIKPFVLRKHILNENYFEVINNEHKAYWLGFILADGCITKSSYHQKNNNRLSINISYKDIELLDRFKEDIEAKNTNITIYIPKNTYSQNQMSKININSVKICNDLSKYGITNAKTGHEVLPNNLPKELYCHFIRGYFDGDGCIWHSKDLKKGGFEFTSASVDFLISLKLFLFNEIKASNNVIPHPSGKQNNRIKNAYQLVYGRLVDIFNFYNYIYKDATIFLQRKKNKFDSLLFSQ